MKNSDPVNNKPTERRRNGVRPCYRSSPEEVAEAERLAAWLATVTLPKSFLLAAGVLVVDGERFRNCLLYDLKETRHTAMFAGALVRARQVLGLFLRETQAG